MQLYIKSRVSIVDGNHSVSSEGFAPNTIPSYLVFYEVMDAESFVFTVISPYGDHVRESNFVSTSQRLMANVAGLV